MRLFLLIVAGLISFNIQAQNRKLHPNSFKDLEISNSWIIVKYEPSAQIPPPARSLKVKLQSTSSESNSKKSILDGLVKIPIRSDQDPIQVCNEYLKDPNVLYAEPIVMDRPLEVPSDPLLENQYYLENIQAFAAWDITKGDDDIAIGIIDTGIDLDHEDLQSNLWFNQNDTIDGVDNDGNGYIDDFIGYDFSEDDNQPESDLDAHGAVVAGIAGAAVDNEVGIAGIGYNTKIAALKGFNSTTGFSSGLFEAILYAADNGIEVVNLSWGSIREPLQSEQDIINYAVLEQDVVVVAAAGNDGSKSTAEEKFYPASYDNVLSVAGSTADDTKWSGSSYNHAVDLIAPASGVFSTTNNDGYQSGFGTSFAAPMVAATAALVKDQFPELSAQQLMERVRVTADDIYDIGGNSSFEGNLGRGRLNALRAVSESNLKSLRAENTTVQSPNSQFFYGDTLQISVDLTNYLEVLSDPSVYISSTQSQFTIDESSYFPGSFGTLQGKELAFKIILSDDLLPESLVGIRLDFQDEAYNDFQFIDITTAPDYAVIGNNEIELSAAGDGRLGVIDYNENIGSGLLFQSQPILTHAGILLAKSAANVSDNIISNYSTLERENDFETQKFYRLQHHPFAANYGYSEFADAANNLQIEQSNITSSNDGFIITRYRIINTTSEPIENLTFGVFNDWDLADKNENYAAFNSEGSYLFARSNDSTTYAATKIIGVGTPSYSALNLGIENGNIPDLDSTFTDQQKYDLLLSSANSAAGIEGNGNDVAGLNGITIDRIDSAGFVYINLIYAAGSSEGQLENALALAEDYLQEFSSNPLVLETIITCNGGSTTINPTEGSQFAFYEDPLGINLIMQGESFAPAAINSDTSFYARNLDQGFPSDIFEIRVRLFEDIASFSVSTDTLYLDHPTANVVNFTDESINPISWQWDFGQGTQSTLQNPSILFNQEGTYQVSLTVENEFGCLDTFSKDLVVAQRPVPLQFEALTLCPNEVTTISDASASELFFYFSPDQQVPTASGNPLSIGPFTQDTTVYISGRVNGFLTVRSALTVDIQEVNAEISVLPDTTATRNQLILEAIADSTATVSWLVNGVEFGSEKNISIPADLGVQVIQLEVLAQNGCFVIVEESFEVSTSSVPEVSNIESCIGSEVILKPTNGEYFAFFADEILTTLIGKGTQLAVSSDTTVFVAGIDDGIPGIAVESTVSFQDFEVELGFTAESINGTNKVQLFTSGSDSIISFRWYLDGEFFDSSPEPTFFFDDILKEIVLEAESDIGCLASDTLNLDFTPPLSVSENSGLSIYPNPTKGELQLLTQYGIEKILVRDLAGKLLLEIQNPKSELDLSLLGKGLYILEVASDESTERVKLILD